MGELGAYFPYTLESSGAAPAVEKAVRILNAVSRSRRPLTLAELCRAVEIPKSSTLAVCTTLVGLRMLRRRADGSYELGPHLAELGRAYTTQVSMPQAFFSVLEEFEILPRETLELAVRADTDVVFVAQRRGDRPLGVCFQLGATLPASCTAAGKALLSGLSDEEIDALYEGKELPVLTEASLEDLDQLKSAVRKVRATGIAVDVEETAVGMICLGVPVIDSSMEHAAAVSVSLIAAETTKTDVNHVSMQLSTLADLVTSRVGGRSREAATV